MTRDKNATDTLYQTPREQIERFRFDAGVTAVFDDMLSRSVPGYDLMLQGIGVAAARFLNSGDRCYDLGASRGNASAAILRACPDLPLHLIAIDNAEPMCNACREQLGLIDACAVIDVHCADLLEVTFEPCRLVVLNLTLQFVPLAERDHLLERIAAALQPGGALLLSEKLEREDDVYGGRSVSIELHEQFKRLAGYSELEIAQKRSALEQVLIAETADAHHQRLARAGFSASSEWFRCFNFSSFLAIK